LSRKNEKKFAQSSKTLEIENSELKKRLTELLANANLMKNKLQEFSVEISTNRNYKQEISGLMVELGLKDSEIAT
jgi:predicted RNase H-like nuclease (RuvC/YqgF family)